MTFALRQAAVISVTLVVAGGVVERLRPDESAVRGFLSTPFWWAAVLWAVLVLADAIIFEQSQLRRLEGPPLVLAAGVGIVVFAIGVLSFSDGSTLQRVVYLAVNAIGAAAFWWALIGLFWLVATPPVTPADDPDVTVDA